MGHEVWYLSHCPLAHKIFHQMDIFYAYVPDLVDWEMVYSTLHDVPKLFQQWAYKQVMGFAEPWNGTKQYRGNVQVAWRSMTIAHTCFFVIMLIRLKHFCIELPSLESKRYLPTKKIKIVWGKINVFIFRVSCSTFYLFSLGEFCGLLRLNQWVSSGVNLANLLYLPI